MKSTALILVNEVDYFLLSDEKQKANRSKDVHLLIVRLRVAIRHVANRRDSLLCEMRI